MWTVPSAVATKGCCGAVRLSTGYRSTSYGGCSWIDGLPFGSVTDAVGEDV